MRILLTGANGQLGQELQPLLAELGEVIAADRTIVDLSQTDQLYNQVTALEPMSLSMRRLIRRWIKQKVNRS